MAWMINGWDMPSLPYLADGMQSWNFKRTELFKRLLQVLLTAPLLVRTSRSDNKPLSLTSYVFVFYKREINQNDFDSFHHFNKNLEIIFPFYSKKLFLKEKLCDIHLKFAGNFSSLKVKS